MAAARHIAPNRIQRTHKLSEPHTGLHFAQPFLGLLPFAKTTDVLRSGFECATQFRRDLLPGVFDLRFAYSEGFACESIELARIAEQCGIALFSNGQDNLGRGLLSARHIESAAIG